MSIAQQVATPNPSQQARHPSRPLVPAPKRRRVRALLGIAGLVAVMAVGVTLTLGTVAVLLVLVASNLTG
jgi:hypothetical protein